MSSGRQLFPSQTSQGARQVAKSPSLVFNASRMARMAGGLTSVMNRSREARRSNAGNIPRAHSDKDIKKDLDTNIQTGEDRHLIED